ncbi:tetratricopeptide repeat-containing glycosyltransferase [Sporofaciens musculi]|uniref:tetratricopeptide repeat-containing glycosyltransferase n=1 Tax=Sporofaciens musculi TaxID=2681861 RepID=UPI00257076D0|nr:glycosyltransferase [Sporofaciens musculi]
MNIQLSISMLVSDRMETLGKCLASLKPLLTELDSELIVVFTGKNEETLELIQQYTTHIIPFTWCDDFSKARNAGLKEAKGEWFLYLDDDEWFEDTREIIQFFKSGEYRRYQSAFYVVRNYLDFEGERFSDGDVGRMCRLTPETEFVFPIHENLIPFSEPCKKLTAFVHHFGYARKETYERKATKTSRNLPPLLEMYEENPNSPQCCMQISQEYRSVGEYDKAVEYCRRGLSLARNDELIYNYELWLQVNLPLLISYTGDLELALEEGERMLKHSRTLEAGSLHLSVTLTALCLKLKKYRKGLRYVRLYHEKLLYLLKHPEKAILQRAPGLTLDSAKKETVPVYMDGLFFAAEDKDFQTAKQILSWMPWEDENQMMPHYPRLEEWKNTFENQKDAILREYEHLKTSNSYVCIQKILFAEKQKRKQKAEELWRECAANCPPGFQWELFEIAVRNQFSLEALLDHMSPEAWNEYSETVTQRKEWAEMQAFYQKIMPLLKVRPFYERKLEQCFLEKLLTRELFEPAKLIELLKQYCTSICTDASFLYKEEVLAKPEAFALPTRYRFAAPLKDALRLIEAGKFIESFPLLKDALHIYPKMSGTVGQLLRYLEEEIQSPKQAVPEEFMLLGEQVKQVLRGLIDGGQWTEAYGVMGQLLSLLPDDLEVLRMKQEILRQGAGIQNLY